MKEAGSALSVKRVTTGKERLGDMTITVVIATSHFVASAKAKLR